MGKIGPTEILLLLVFVFGLPVLIYRIGYNSGKIRGQRDEMLRREQQEKEDSLK